MEKYNSRDDFYYSILYGNGVYQDAGSRISDPISTSVKNKEYSPVVSNVKTGEQFFLRCFSKKYLKHYQKMIWYPPSQASVLWPLDIVELNEKQRADCNVYVGQRYSDGKGGGDQKKQEAHYALLFPASGYPKRENLNTKLKDLKLENKGVMNWKNKEIQRLAVKIVQAIKQLNNSGYYFYDFHISDFHTSPMFINEDGTVFFNFTNMIFARDDFDVANIERGEYPIEFAEPAFVNGDEKPLNYHSQNYSLSAMLFYLCFDRYAYETSDIKIEYRDDTVQDHYIKFLDILPKESKFIFTPELDLIKEERREEETLLQLWEECPEEMKEMFQCALGNEHPNYRNEEQIPTPEDWLNYFHKLNWY